MAQHVWAPWTSCFEKCIWGHPAAPDCVQISQDGVVAVAAGHVLLVYIPVYGGLNEYDCAWMYMETDKVKPDILTGLHPGTLDRTTFDKWIKSQSISDLTTHIFEKISWAPAGLRPGSPLILVVNAYPHSILFLEIDYFITTEYDISSNSKICSSCLRLSFNFSAFYLQQMNEHGLVDASEVQAFQWLPTHFKQEAGRRQLIFLALSQRNLSFWGVTQSIMERDKLLVTYIAAAQLIDLEGDDAARCLCVKSADTSECTKNGTIFIGTKQGMIIHYAFEVKNDELVGLLCIWKNSLFVTPVDRIIVPKVNNNLLLATSTWHGCIGYLPSSGQITHLDHWKFSSKMTLHKQTISSIALIETSSQEKLTFVTSSLDGYISYWIIDSDSNSTNVPSIRKLGDTYKSSQSIMGLCVDSAGFVVSFVETVPAEHIDTNEVQANSTLRRPYAKFIQKPVPFLLDNDGRLNPDAVVEAVNEYVDRSSSWQYVKLNLISLLQISVFSVYSMNTFKPLPLLSDLHDVTTSKSAVDEDDKGPIRRSLSSISADLYSRYELTVSQKLEKLFNELITSFYNVAVIDNNMHLLKALYFLLSVTSLHCVIPLSVEAKSVVNELRPIIESNHLLALRAKIHASNILLSATKVLNYSEVRYLALIALLVPDMDDTTSSIMMHIHETYNFVHCSTNKGHVSIGEVCDACGEVLPVGSLTSTTCENCGLIFDRCCRDLHIIDPSDFQSIVGCQSCKVYAQRCITSESTTYSTLDILYLTELLCIFCSKKLMPII